MAYSQETKLATGLNNRFSFTFSGLGRGYISRDDIHVYINDVEVGKTFEAGTDNVLIVGGPVLAAGTEVLIRRVTPKDKPIVDWQDTGLLREDILDTANEQLLYALHEVLDGYGLTDVQVDINMNGNKITGVGVDLNDPDSLITVGGVGPYRDDSIAAAQAAAQSASNAYSEHQNAQTERILAEAQRSLAQQAAVDSQASATAADDSEAQALAHANNALQAALDANAKLQELITTGMPVPIGMMAPFPVNRQPSGWAVVMGQTLQRTVYPQAVTYLTGNTTTPSFTLPDLRGEFLRGADLGRGVNTAVTPGSSVGQSVQSHSHALKAMSAGFSGGAANHYVPHASGTLTMYPITDTGGSETAPRHVGVVWCIKLANHPVDLTQADINGVLAALNTMAQSVNPNNGKYSILFCGDTAAQQTIPTGVLTTVQNGGTSWMSGDLGLVPTSDGSLGLVIQEAGNYLVAAYCAIYSGANAGAYGYITKNGAPQNAALSYGQTTQQCMLQTQGVLTCAVGDILRVGIAATSAACVVSNGVNRRLSVQRIR